MKEFSTNDIILNTRLKLIENGIQANIYDDLDFFPFLTNDLTENIIKKSDSELIKERMLQVKTQIAIVRSIKIFVKQLKLGKVNFPRAVDLLKLIREDRRILQTQISNYEQSCNQIVLKQLDVQGVY